MRLQLQPREALKSRMAYTMHLSSESFVDWEENALSDTTLQWATLNKDTLSELMGTVFDEDSLAYGPLFLTARSLADLEPNRANAYRQLAEDTLDDLVRGARRIAQKYNARARATQQTDPQAARRLFGRAISWDPQHTIGKDGLAELDHTALVLYNQARDKRNAGRTEEAVEMFEDVLRYAEEGSPYYQRASRHLAELRAPQPE